MQSARQPASGGSQQYRIITQYGDMVVVRQGISSSQYHHQHHQHSEQSPKGAHQARPVIMTFHDLGLNSELQWAGFCESDEVKLMLQTFTMLHVNFIGQEPQAASLPDDFRYPSVEQLAECIVDVCAHLRVRSFIALAVGAGAHIASLLALQRPDLVDGLFLINPVVSSCSITEWLYFKMSAIASNHHHHSHHHPADHTSTAATSSSADSTAGDTPSGGHLNHTKSLRKLLRAAHIHLPQHQHHQQRTLSARRHSQERAEATSSAAAADQASLQSGSTSSLASGSGSSSTGGRAFNPGGSRLRRLILSRNFRLAAAHPDSQAAAASSGQSGAKERKSSHGSQVSAGGASNELNEPADQAVASIGGKRPPLEYLMYHHFGPTTFQRYRRRSSGGSGSSGSSPADLSPARSAARSHESLAPSGSGGGGSQRHAPSAATPPMQQARARSGSLRLLSSAYLNSLGGERQRHAHMQAAYRHHFGQVNAHNLWLFATSFAKRRSLNLRKDCGAAAHAAACAAALGTSISMAFVGAAGPPVAANQPHHQVPASKEPNILGAGETGKEQSQQVAQVAGTKVKRTFACQTLVMCSSVGLHGERAFKLMALLNPLQATCIKTDQLLVLEEKPEKVCQALRLFLQGIGYSMSTYERRLRLSSHTGSAGSNDSGGSIQGAGGGQAGESSLGQSATTSGRQ